MSVWTPKTKDTVDAAILAGRSDTEIAADLEAGGFAREQALYRAANRRSKLLRSGHNVATPAPTAAAPSAVAPQDVADLIETLVRREVGALAAPSVDVDTVRALVRSEIGSVVAPRNVTIEVRRLDGSSAKIDGAHYLMPRLLNLLAAGFHVYLWGPAGSGKSTAQLQAAEALGMRAEVDTLDPTTTRSMIQGYKSPTGEKVLPSFARCYTEGGAYIAEELDLSPAAVQSLKNSGLANGHTSIAGESAARAPGFLYMGNGNTPGRPTAEFPDRKPMSAAFRDRLYFMYWPIDENIERRACGIAEESRPERHVVTCSPVAWGEWVLSARAWCRANAPTVMVTPRATHAGLRALAAGESVDEIADALVFRGCDSDLRAKVLYACPLPTESAREMDAPDAETAPAPTPGASYRYRVIGTKFTDFAMRDRLKGLRGRWEKSSKTWLLENVSDSAIAELRSAGLTVEAA